MSRSLLFAVGVLLIGGCSGWPVQTIEPDDQQTVPEASQTDKPLGLVQLIEFHDIQGLRNWAHELEQRELKSLVYIQANMLEEYPEDIRWLADHGHEIAGGYADEALWDVDYDTQLQVMRETKELVEQVTGKPMRVFGSRYFAYDRTTLQAADALGVEFVLARGTSDVEAIIYDPDEYDCKIISVSNVTFEDMGRGSLCDYSLWARGATAADFEQIVDESLDKHPERIMVVSHAYLGGMKASWWEVYKDLLDSDAVRWAEDFDAWVSPRAGVNISVPLDLIPENREVQYTTPTPSEPLEELEDVGEMHNPCAAPGDGGTEDEQGDSTDDGEQDSRTGKLLMFHNNRGPMCMDALEWLEDKQAEYPELKVEEHLTYETGEAEQLNELEAEYGSSQGVSESFGYLPIIFYQGQAFSGFDEQVAQSLDSLVSAEFDESE